MNEAGYAGFEAVGWNALVAPAGTPRDIVDKINVAVNAFLASEGGKQQLDKMGMTPLGGTPDQLAGFLASESAKWGSIIKDANISLQ
jgi:tripartite-type tricarboxylate transporter receptor subunit TctC